MSKGTKIILRVIIIVHISIAIDIFCILNINRPIFVLKKLTLDKYNIIYRGILYDTYNCAENSIPQIKMKNAKYTCNIAINNKGRILEIVDTTKNINNFSCAEILEQFYEDENYKYFYSCIKSKYIIVKYESGYEETAEEALKQKRLKIADLDNHDINYYKYNK